MQVCFWLCSGHSHKVLDGCLERCSCLLSCLLAGCLLNEGARESSSRQAITPARYDEGTLATNHNAATGERGYHSIYICIYLMQRWHAFYNAQCCQVVNTTDVEVHGAHCRMTNVVTIITVVMVLPCDFPSKHSRPVPPFR